MCTDAYRQALIRDLSSRASSAPTPAPSHRHTTETGYEGVAALSLRRGTTPGPDDPETSGAAAAGAVAGASPTR
jgi:hypothetical protein